MISLNMFRDFILPLNNTMALISHVGAVGCLNNDRSVMSKPFAWRPLGLLPILKPGPCTNNNIAWQRYRRLDLYHRCMDPIIA